MRNSILSPAKVNLGLSITGRRTDGYHLLESLFWPVNFGDTIEITLGSGRTLTEWSSEAPFSTANLPEESQNVVTKILKSLSSQPIPLDFHIRKSIPIGGGMGGGSSNAGTILAFLIKNKIISLPNAETWSSQFGADIPFFLHQKPSWVTGIGEKISPLICEESIFKSLYFLLVFLPIGCETKLIFDSYKKSKMSFTPTQNPFPEKIVTLELLKRFLSATQNDFEPLVRHLYPSIGTTLDKLRSQNCFYAGLSGSGSTCFAIFDCVEKGKKTSQDLQTFFRINNCKSILTETFETR